MVDIHGQLQSLNLWYRLSDQFDYFKYLERQSHFNSVSIAISDQTQALIGSQKEIEDILNNGFSGVNQSLKGMSEELSGIANLMRETNSLLCWGFSEIVNELSGINETRPVAKVHTSDSGTAGLIA